MIMNTKRVLIVDDSHMYQRLLSEVIEVVEGLEVVGVASNGKIALEMIDRVKPDVVTLDILMPEMDGIQTLIELRKRWPQTKTVMVSSLTTEGSEAALDALALGASEFAVKPSSAGGIANVHSDLQEDLVPKILALCGIKESTIVANEATQPSDRTPVVSRERVSPIKRGKKGGIDIVAIGVSTGGPDALSNVLSQMPEDLGVPVVIVQHMPAQFTAKLASRLDAASALTVVEAQAGDKLEANTVYIAPGDYHMELKEIQGEVVINLNQDEPENSCRPSVDPLFRSIPSIFGSQCLGVVLTGMGSDGLAGCNVLSGAGCPIIVQDKDTSIVWGMPKLIVQAGLALEQLPIDQMATAITERVRGRSRIGIGNSANSGFHRSTTALGGCT